jgi:hypothetical protein
MTEEEKTFIKEKSIEFFKRENQVEFNNEDIEITMQRLSGISNIIFRVQILSEKFTFKNDTIFFKVFGRISSNQIFNFRTCR